MVAEEEKKLNATYIISVARKLGCTVFLLPEDIMEVTREFHISCTYKFDKKLYVNNNFLIKQAYINQH